MRSSNFVDPTVTKACIGQSGGEQESRTNPRRVDVRPEFALEMN